MKVGEKSTRQVYVQFEFDQVLEVLLQYNFSHNMPKSLHFAVHVETGMRALIEEHDLIGLEAEVVVADEE